MSTSTGTAASADHAEGVGGGVNGGGSSRSNESGSGGRNLDDYEVRNTGSYENAPDLLPPLVPEGSRGSSTTSPASATALGHATGPINAGTEAEEERTYLAGDFAPSEAGTAARQRRPDLRSRRSSQRHDPSRAAKGVRERVLHFTPSWFSVVMGTGVIATLLNLLPWAPLQKGVKYPAAVWLILAMFLFIFFTVGFTARYILFPQVLRLTITHSQKSFFLGTIPMGLTVIVSNICQLGLAFDLGPGPVQAAAGLWWLAVFLSLLTAFGVPFVATTFQSHSFSSTTAALLLPVVPTITAAATGSVIAEALANLGHSTYAFTIVVVSYLILGVGLPMAMVILALYFQRLLLFKQPPREVIISTFLPLGPCGQGGEALLHLGQVAYQLFPTISAKAGSGVKELTLPVGQGLFAAGLLGALMLWGLGIFWAFIAVGTVLRELRRGALKFSLGWWAATFPLGSMAICTVRLALVLDSLALKITYTGFVLVTLAVWFTVAIPTAIGFINGELLSRNSAPCIADLPLDPLKKSDEEDAAEEQGAEPEMVAQARSEESGSQPTEKTQSRS